MGQSISGGACDAHDSKNPWMVIEGLAYIPQLLLPFRPSRKLCVHGAIQQDNVTRLDSAHCAKIAQDENLDDVWIAKCKARCEKKSGVREELIPAGFQWEFSTAA